LTINIPDFCEFTLNPSDVSFCEILKNEGSAPREIGAWMLVKRSGQTLGTIGGGQLEFKLMEQLKDQDWSVNFKYKTETILGPEIGQCCGGKVLLSVKKLNQNLRAKLLMRLEEQLSYFPQVLIFGAGNIGVSLAYQMDYLPLKVKLIDNREKYILNLGGSFEKKFCLLPEQQVRDASPDTAFIIVTHDHGLDFMLCHEVLIRNDSSYVGMIGSKSKKGVLANWLRKKGINNFNKVKIPIGKTFLDSKDKRPEIISAYIISEMLFYLEMNNKSFNQVLNNPVLGD